MTQAIAVVLAAGKGTRMESELPKVLVPAGGRPMIEFVLTALREAGIGRILVVVGYRADQVRETLKGWHNLEFVDQPEQLGTGHAVKMCREQLAADAGPVLIVTGDSPLLQVDSVKQLLQLYAAEQPACILGTLLKEDPFGLGRIVRDPQGNFLGIVEEKDATAEQRAIREVNMSTYVFARQELVPVLDRLSNSNVQREYYITDAPGILRAEGKDVRALPVLKPCEALSVNRVSDLPAVEQAMRQLGMIG